MLRKSAIHHMGNNDVGRARDISSFEESLLISRWVWWCDRRLTGGNMHMRRANRIEGHEDFAWSLTGKTSP
jgi:hypothetical protein